MIEFLRKFHKYVSNSSWILADKFLGLATSFVVSIVLARRLGPDKFGSLSYAISIMSLFAIAGHMGISGIAVRELVKNPSESEQTLGTVFCLKALGYGIGFLAIIGMALGTEELGSPVFWALIIVGASLLFRPWDTIDFWFQAKVQSKYNAISGLVSRLASSGLKLAAALAGLGLIALSFAQLAQSVIATVILLWFYHKATPTKTKLIQFDKSKAKQLLSQGILVFAGSVFAVINLKIDQVMLKWIAGSSEVGYYSVASTLSEAWYFVPMAIVTSVFPRLIQLRTENTARYNFRLQQVLDLLFGVAFVVAIGVSVMASPVIHQLYGTTYDSSIAILKVHVWTGLFVFMRALFSRWIIIEDLLVFSLVTQGLGALANVLLNLFLIPSMGGYGAAISTLFSYAVSSYFALLVSARTRGMFWMMTKAMAAPLRYPLALAQRGLAKS